MLKKANEIFEERISNERTQRFLIQELELGKSFDESATQKLIEIARSNL